MNTKEISRLVPHIRPHNRLREGKIYFMLSKRPTLELCTDDLLLYQVIDGIRTVEQLETLHPGASSRLRKWHEAAVIELVEPVKPPRRPHIVVIEPHMDDAVLSAGGRLLHRRGRARITILSVVKRSNFTSYLLLNRDFRDVQAVTDLRQKESDLIAKLLGAEHRSLDWSDAPIRFWQAERWDGTTVERFKATPQGFVKLFPNPADIALLTEQLAQALLDLAPDELWIPMGFGDHIDHRMTRAACLRVLADHPQRFAKVTVSMYEDLPYAGGEGSDRMERSFLDSGASLSRATEDISDVFEEKLRLASIYASQFKLSYMEPPLRKSAEAAGGAGARCAEAFFRLRELRMAPSESILSRERDGLEKLQRASRTVMSSKHVPQQFTIMALPTGQIGNWERIRRALIQAFPDATFQLYASSASAWQIEDDREARFQIHIVPDGRFSWYGWAKVIIAELLSPTPTIVLWQGAYASEPMRAVKELINCAIRLLLPLRQVLFARALWDFCCVIEGCCPTKQTNQIADLEVASI